ncbi:unnamed protein product [Agarophyton chilense]
MSNADTILSLYVVDAFVPPETKSLGKGNPAAIIPLRRDQVDSLNDEQMQTIAAELGLSETTFLFPTEERGAYRIRWFTPSLEVQLCGHATLAAAFVLQLENKQLLTMEFITTKGERLNVKKSEHAEDRLPAFHMEFPALLEKGNLTELEKQDLAHGLGIPRDLITSCYLSDYDIVAVLENWTSVQNLRPRLESLSGLRCRGVIATARGFGNVCFVSRFFAPSAGISEDPVTGSAHCALAPLYLGSNRDGKFYRAEQLSKRGGVVMVRMISKDRVELKGRVRLVSKGALYL